MVGALLSKKYQRVLILVSSDFLKPLTPYSSQRGSCKTDFLRLYLSAAVKTTRRDAKDF